jgi:hypothetical protein
VARRAMDVLVAALLSPACAAAGEGAFTRLVSDSLFHCLQACHSLSLSLSLTPPHRVKGSATRSSTAFRLAISLRFLSLSCSLSPPHYPSRFLSCFLSHLIHQRLLIHTHTRTHAHTHTPTHTPTTHTLRRAVAVGGGHGAGGGPPLQGPRGRAVLPHRARPGVPARRRRRRLRRPGGGETPPPARANIKTHIDI